MFPPFIPTESFYYFFLSKSSGVCVIHRHRDSLTKEGTDRKGVFGFVWSGSRERFNEA